MPSSFSKKVEQGCFDGFIGKNIFSYSGMPESPTLADLLVWKGFIPSYNFVTASSGGANTTVDLFEVQNTVVLGGLFLFTQDAKDSTTFNTVYFELDDGAAQIDITASAGVAADGIINGSSIIRTSSDNTVAATYIDVSNGVVANIEDFLMPDIIAQKSGESTIIRMNYTADGSTDIDFQAMCLYKSYFGGNVNPPPAP